MIKTIKKTATTFTLALLACSVYNSANATTNANVNTDILKTQGSGLSDIVPNNWNILDSQTGDVNNDGIDDLVFVIQDTDETKIINDNWGKSDYNPRILAIYKGTNTGYTQEQLVADFIPLKDSPSLLEPFNKESKGIEISDEGVIQLYFDYFMSAGGWGMSDETYKFQLRDGDYQLIGYDYLSIMRNSLEVTKFSANFLNNTIIKSHYYDGKDDVMDESREGIFRDKKVNFDFDERFTLSNFNKINYTVRDILYNNRHYPKAKGTDLTEVIAPNWNVLSKTMGDLNQDGIQDIVVTVQDTDSNNINTETDYNSNQKLIVIYFGAPNGLIRQGAYSENGFNEYQVSIDKNGILKLYMEVDYSDKGNAVKEIETYKFQFRDRFSGQIVSRNSNQQFMLIGYDKLKKTAHSNGTVEEELSVNFLTRKAIYNDNGDISIINFRLNELLSIEVGAGHAFRFSPLETLEQWRIQ